jgi:xylulokinase
VTANTILTADLGGSSLKAGLFSDDGELLSTASVPLGFDEPREGFCEADPEIWWRALVATFADLAAATGDAFDRVGAIALCGFTRTQVLLDGEARVVRPAIGFRDARAGAEVEAALARPGVAAHGHARHLNVYHPLARLLWVAAHQPELWARVAAVIEPKDFLNLRLTGAAASDPVSQHWLIGATDGGAASLAGLAGLRVPAPPRLLAPHGMVGRVAAGHTDPTLRRLHGVPVFCGGNDSWTAVAGLGALTAGRAYGISGSSEVFGLLAGRAAEAEGLLTLPWGDGLWQIGGPGLNGANALAWIVDTLDRSERPFETRLAELLAGPTCDAPLLFLPYLLGERTPHWDSDLRAAFLGLSAHHRPGDLVRAVMAGVAHLNREVLERAEAAAGAPAREVRIGGGGAGSPVWNRIRADVLGREIIAMPNRQMGLSGAFAVAGVGLGRAPDLAAAIDRTGLDFQRFRPNGPARRRADRLHAVFRDAHASIAEISHRLAAVDERP